MSILDPQKTFWGSSLSPASVVYITVKSPAAGTTANAKSLALKKSLVEAAKPFPIPENAPNSGEAENAPYSGEAENGADSEKFRVSKTVVVGDDSLESPANVETSKKSTIPKWLKLNKS